MTPYTDRLRAGYYDTKKKKTTKADTTTQKLSGVTQAKSGSKKS